MIKHFCDVCETEMKDDERREVSARNKLVDDEVTVRGALVVSVVVTAQVRGNPDADICTPCILNAVEKLRYR